MRVLLLGGSGQLGRAIRTTAPVAADLAAPGHNELDLTCGEGVLDYCTRISPEIVINAAAYTAVDRAESEAQLCRRVNADGAGNIARAASRCGARMFHVSTDYVFDGERGAPYAPDDPTNPVNEYGRSKRDGELSVLAHCRGTACIVRTSWLYDIGGGNFVNTMLRLMRMRDPLQVVHDQVGTPTWARGLATAIWQLVDKAEATGILHWTDAGVCSWYDFAVAIHEEALAIGLLDGPVEIVPIPGSEFPTPARRPRFSVLDKSGCWRILGHRPVHWRASLRTMLKEMRKHDGA